MTTVAAVGPSPTTFSAASLQHSTSGRILSLAVAADQTTVYAGSYAGVWRSRDAGLSWQQLVGPALDAVGPDILGGIYAPFIFDLAASPVDANLVLAAATGGQFVISRDGIYRSTDGGNNWALTLNARFVNEIVFAPDDPTLVYAALGWAVAISRDAGANWDVVPVGSISPLLPGGAQHLAVAPQEGGGLRRVYAAAGDQIWYSTDGGGSWSFDPGSFTIASARRAVSDFQVACQLAAGQDPNPMPPFAGMTANAAGSGAHILAVEPGDPTRIYLAALGGANGPSYYQHGVPDGTRCNTTCARLAGEASLWYGDFRRFDDIGRALWGHQAGPPVYHGGSTPSGNAFVVAKPTSAGYLLFFSDNSHVHVCAGRPSGAASWHRLDGKNVSATAQAGQHENLLFMHVDPHALAFTADFEIALKRATGVSFPFDQNSVLDAHVGGKIWMANDGGVTWSEDGGQSWKHPAGGLDTLDPVNIAGLFGIGDAPALYFGCGDNDDFFSRDGGASWGDPVTECGDCDAWFADIAQPNRLLQFVPRGDGLNVVTSDDPSQYPDASNGSSFRFIPATRTPAGKPYASSGAVLRGFRPLIRTLATEAPLADGDYVFIHFRNGERVLLRTTSISAITQISDWDDPAKAEQIGTALPPGADIVQASGGHQNPVFYVADTGAGRLWKWDASGGMWKPLVPGGPPGRSAGFALRFFVDPFDPEVVYLVDQSGTIKVSLDGGESWLPERSLTQVATAGGKIRGWTSSVIVDMLFSRGERPTRFAFGDAGVSCSTNGFEWFTLLDSTAIPGRPESGFFDPLSDPSDRGLYVTFEGRSVLRLGSIPGPPPFEPPQVLDLLEFAAIEA